MARALEKGRDSRTAPGATPRGATGSEDVRYAIAQYQDKDPKLFCVPLKPGEEALLVFSSRTAVQDFLSRCPFEPESHAMGFSAAELISLLVGTCANLDWVLLDPFPGCLAVVDGPPNLMPWHRCVDHMLG